MTKELSVRETQILRLIAEGKSEDETVDAKPLADLEEKSAALTARWSREKNKLSDAAKLKSELDALRIDLANAQRHGQRGEQSRQPDDGTAPVSAARHDSEADPRAERHRRHRN